MIDEKTRILGESMRMKWPDGIIFSVLGLALGIFGIILLEIFL